MPAPPREGLHYAAMFVLCCGCARASGAHNSTHTHRVAVGKPAVRLTARGLVGVIAATSWLW